MRIHNFWHKNITRTHELGVKRCGWQLISVSKHKHQWKCGLNEHSASSNWESVLRERNAMTHSKKMENARLCQILVSFSAQCLYWKRRIIIVIWARHTGQPASSWTILVERSFHRNVRSHTSPTRTGQKVPTRDCLNIERWGATGFDRCSCFATLALSTLAISAPPPRS